MRITGLISSLKKNKLLRKYILLGNTGFVVMIRQAVQFWSSE